MAALAGALDLIRNLGGGTVEGYPEDAGSVPAGFLFNGALSSYERLGFTRDRKIGRHESCSAHATRPAGRITPDPALRAESRHQWTSAFASRMPAERTSGTATF